MKAFFRDNPTIAFGLVLPLLLVIVMLAVSGLPDLFVNPPQYDLVYATNYNEYNGLKIQVMNKKAQATYTSEGYYVQLPHIWYYSPKTGAVREIAVNLPANLAPPPSNYTGARPHQSGTVGIPDLSSLTLDASSISPDGYMFRSSGYGSSPELFTGLFFSSRYRNDAVLVKQGRHIRLPDNDSSYSGYAPHFIGWVIPR